MPIFKITVKGVNYLVHPSKQKTKKYDVFLDAGGGKFGKYVTSYGSRAHEHYKDYFGYYKAKDHLNSDRRRLYRLRHAKDNIDNPNYAGFWSYNFLWD